MTSSGQGATRREFLGYAAAAGAGAGWLDFPLALRSLVAAEDVGNPLEHYPTRGWEKVYRDQYAYDSTFTWVCSPNDTHAC
ncbi:MAG TPA: twin-arginine translocation signal domain-containing protein, partial [Candidatus Methylomirabilis sp.]|nr:twin-arginine translocation signal domain-containing protein [Candidatus Methylomirabilis sp.]